MNSAGTRTWRVLKEMTKEEWRLHTTLFGGRRFAGFPLIVALFVAIAVWALLRTGTSTAGIVAGMHALVFLFGLHTGSVGLVGREAVRNLLGDVTLLVFSARTLPLSRRRLLGVFIVKDVGYYALLFLLPMAAGTVPAAIAAGAAGQMGSGSGAAPSVVLGALLLWIALVGTFMLGMGTTLSALGLSSRGRTGRLALLVVLAGIAAAWVAGAPILEYTPYGFFRAPSVTRAIGVIALVGLLLGFGGLSVDVQGSSPTRTEPARFRRWNEILADPLSTKTLLDVHRSAGGFGKVLFSAGILLVVTLGLVDLAARITGVAPSMGISIGAILGLSAFTTYNWLTQFDDVESYLVLPTDVSAVFRAKYRAFLVLGPAVGLVALAIAVGYRGGRLLEVAVGALLLVGVTTYIYGVTVFLAGLSPNEFLFDSLLFGVFALAVMVPLVPTLVVGFALAPIGTTFLGALALGSVGLGVAGYLLYRRSLPRWETHHRS
ncbi:MAG: hypothetical protein ABEI31_03220 [Halodesulfurarchaeum sp.]